jgi:hypothetical protein
MTLCENMGSTLVLASSARSTGINGRQQKGRLRLAWVGKQPFMVKEKRYDIFTRVRFLLLP